MSHYFDLQMLYDENAYSIRGEEISFLKPDRYKINECGLEPHMYFSNFVFSINQKGYKQGFLANNLGWIIIDCTRLPLQNHWLWREVEYVNIPLESISQDADLDKYKILKIKKEIPCLDYGLSDLIWESNDEGELYIAAVKKLVLRDEFINGFHIFRISEAPFIPVISQQVYTLFKEVELSGWKGKKIEVNKPGNYDK